MALSGKKKMCSVNNNHVKLLVEERIFDPAHFQYFKMHVFSRLLHEDVQFIKTAEDTALEKTVSSSVKGYYIKSCAYRKCLEGKTHELYFSFQVCI